MNELPVVNILSTIRLFDRKASNLLLNNKHARDRPSIVPPFVSPIESQSEGMDIDLGEKTFNFEPQEVYLSQPISHLVLIDIIFAYSEPISWWTRQQFSRQAT